MDPASIRKVNKLLSDKNLPIAIITHTNPDGDALGSSLGLFGYFKAAGFTDVSVVLPNDFPSFLKWLPWQEEIIIADQNPEVAHETLQHAKLIFLLDLNGLGRAENMEKSLRNTVAVKVLIDHHPQPENDFDIVFSDLNVSSTAELIYKFIVALGGKALIDKPIAECLYSGIITDTGSFSYSCNHPETYEITARLIKLGVDGEQIQRLIYNNNSADRIRLLGFCLSQKLRVMPQQKTAYISLTIDELKKFNHQEGDTEGVVNYALSIENIKLAALFIEKAGHVKISFRSVGSVDVNKLARNHFNGGGHVNASGGKSFENLEQTINRFEELVISGQI